MSFDESIFESQQRVEQTCKFFCHYSLTDCFFYRIQWTVFSKRGFDRETPGLLIHLLYLYAKTRTRPVHNARGEAPQ